MSRGTSSVLIVALLHALALAILPVRAQVVITEFMASNSTVLADEEGDYPDWVELHNPSRAAVDLLDWSLTDDPGAGSSGRWTLPSTNLGPGGFLVVFASGKDRRVPGMALHTSFRLSQQGEPLALYDPSGRLADGTFVDWVSPQVPDISVGRGLEEASQTWVPAGAQGEYVVPSGDEWDESWAMPAVHRPGWRPRSGGIGYDDRPPGPFTLHPHLTHDIRDGLTGGAGGVYLRIPFWVDAAVQPAGLNLHLRFPDGFAAFLNGVEVASLHRPEVLAWDSKATSHRNPVDLASEQVIILGRDAPGILKPGTNWLAIHGFNSSVGQASFLVDATLVGRMLISTGTQIRYFTQPTPGRVNGAGVDRLGPALGRLPEPPAAVPPNHPVPVWVTASPTFLPVKRVELRYRVGFGAEQVLPMSAVEPAVTDAGPGRVYGAEIPANQAGPGQLLRWYVSAEDDSGASSRWPPVGGPEPAPEYVGTVGEPSHSSPLPTLRWFVAPADVGPASSLIGARCSVHFDGELYDNVYVRIRGQISLGWAKKSHKIDFNPGHHFRFDPREERVAEININSTWSDKSNVRQILSWETFRLAGAPHCRSFPLRLEQNGGFHSLAIFVEHPDERYLRRNGLDPEGSLYKMNSALDSTAGAEKKLPKDDDLRELEELIAGIGATHLLQREFVFDHLNLPGIVNYLAVNTLLHDNDAVAKNYFLYRDTHGTREWSMLAWDKDLTFGHNYRSRVGLTDDIWADFDRTNTLGSDHPFSSPSHPLYGDRFHQKDNGQWNRLIDLLYRVPETRQMYLRRLRTLMDAILQAPQTPFHDRWYERRLDELHRMMRGDAMQDRARWGDPAYGFPRDMGTDITFLQADYLVPRRIHLFVTHHETNSFQVTRSARIPEAQPADVRLVIRTLDRSPASGNQREEYIEIHNPNPTAVDLSGMMVTGMIRHAFHPGTVVPSSGSLYLSPDVRSFRARRSGPTGGQGLFVQGNYEGLLGPQAGALVLQGNSRALARLEVPDVSTSLQKSLRIVKILHAPGGFLDPGEELEYVELRNTGSQPLDLAGVRFVEGIFFNFPVADPIRLPATTDLDAHEGSAYLVRNRAAFERHYGRRHLVVGEFQGRLDNAGERVRLVDASGETIHELSYDPGAVILSQGHGFPMVLAPEHRWENQTLPGRWSAGSWEGLPGPPGAARPLTGPFPAVTLNEVISSPSPPGGDQVELLGPPGTNIGGWYISDDSADPLKYRIPPGTQLPAQGYWIGDTSSWTTGRPGIAPFRLSPGGGELHLWSADASGKLTGYHHTIRYPALHAGQAFASSAIPGGSTSHWQLASQSTPGATNSAPVSPGWTLSEVHFHPVHDEGSAEDPHSEFIEIQNRSALPLSGSPPGDPRNPVRLDGTVSFEFPTSFSLAAGGFVVVVGFDPQRAPWLGSQFRTQFRMPGSVELLGPWRRRLNNGSGTLELRVPTTNATGTHYTTADQMDYRDEDPQGRLADGMGPSLHRLDPGRWAAVMPSPGQSADPGHRPRIIIQPTDRVQDGYSPLQLGVLAGPGRDYQYQWRFAGRPIKNAARSVLALQAAPPSASGWYDVMVMGRGGVEVSRAAEVRWVQPPMILSHPTLPLAVAGSNHTFRVSAVGSGPLTYQWLRNQRDLPGATESSLTLTQLNFHHEGLYSVRVRDAVSTAHSETALVSLVHIPGNLLPPESQMVNVGGTIRLSVNATGTAPIAYLWRKDGISLRVPSSAVLTIPNARLTNAGVYSVLLSNVVSKRFLSPHGRANVIVLTDEDRDGMPDIWELTYQLEYNNPLDAIQDSDFDGQLNLHEYQAGTNPRDPEDHLRWNPMRLRSLPVATPLLGFNAVSNRSYLIQSADAIGGEWSDWLRFPALTTNYPVEVPIDVTSGPLQRNYRLVLPGTSGVP